MARKHTQHDGYAVEEDAEDGDDHAHLDDDRQSAVGGGITWKVSHILHCLSM